MKKFLTLSMLTALVLVGCNKGAAPTTIPSANEGGVVAIPKECPKKSTVTVKADDIDMTVSEANSWYIETKPDEGQFFFTNYTVTEPMDAIGHSDTGNDAKGYFTLRTNDETPISNGIWDPSEIGISGTNANRFIGGEKNKVEITYIGKDYVCGNVSVDDGYGSIKGDFIAKYSKWKSLFE